MTNTIEIENLNISDLDIPKDETLQEVATACEDIATSSEGIATSCESVATACGDIAKDTTLQSTNTALGSLAADTTLQATNTALGGLNISLGGIIKDATGQSIDASVGNISTVLSDVATDTTLATVAKDTTLQATNTALGSLMADNTGQDIKDSLDDIKSAVQGLGTALGADRALIDGSNIGDQATFRTNIGINATNTPFDNTGTEAGNNVQDALKGLWNKIVKCNNNAQFPNLLANEQERWLIGMTRLSVADGCLVIACKYNNVVSVTEIFKSSSFAYSTNAQGTIAFTYGGSATGVRGGAIRIY